MVSLSLSLLREREREKTIVADKYKRHQQHAQSLYSFSNGYASFSSVWFFCREEVVEDSPLPLVAVGFFGVWMARTTTLDDFFAVLLRRLFFPRFNLFPPEKQIASLAENSIAWDYDDIVSSKSGECNALRWLKRERRRFYTLCVKGVEEKPCAKVKRERKNYSFFWALWFLPFFHRFS